MRRVSMANSMRDPHDQKAIWHRGGSPEHRAQGLKIFAFKFVKLQWKNMINVGIMSPKYQICYERSGCWSLDVVGSLDLELKLSQRINKVHTVNIISHLLQSPTFGALKSKNNFHFARIRAIGNTASTPCKGSRITPDRRCEEQIDHFDVTIILIIIDILEFS